MASPPSTMSRPPTSGPPKSAEIAENDPAVASTVCLALVRAVEEGHRHADDGSERDERRLRAEHSAERQRAEPREGDAWAVGQRRGSHREPVERAVASVPGQKQPDECDDHAADCRQPDDQVPGRPE